MEEKYHSDRSRSTLAPGKQFWQIFFNSQIFCAPPKFAVTNLKMTLKVIISDNYFVYFLENCVHLGQVFYLSELSYFWCHSNNQRWCWLSERVWALRGIWTKLGKHLKLWCLWMKLIIIQPQGSRLSRSQAKTSPKFNNKMSYKKESVNETHFEQRSVWTQT